MQTTKVQEQVKAKHPTRKEEDYWSAEDIEEREKLEVSTQNFIRLLDLKAGTGPSGFSNAMLWALQAEEWNPNSPESQALHRLDLFGELYMNDRLPKWYVYKMLSVKQLGLDKGKERRDTGDPDFRFIAVGENLRRLYWKSTFKLSGECFKEYSEPFQLA